MKIVCCRCKNEYPLKLYELESANRPVIICPHCKFQHIVDFLPIDNMKEVEIKEIEKLDLKDTPYISLTASRIADANRVNKSGGDNTDAMEWPRINDFILATQVTAPDKVIERRYKLRWRDYTDSGTFADVASTGEISYSATTVLVDGATLIESNKLCAGAPAGTWWDGLESEGDNELPDSPDTYDLYYGEYTEFQWALDCSSADFEHYYEFELYEITNGVAIGTALSDVRTKYATYKLEGVTKDKDGNVKGTCECFLCKDNGDNTCTYVGYEQSDGSGNYSFTGLENNDAAYFVISWKDDTPHVFDVTDHVLQPILEV